VLSGQDKRLHPITKSSTLMFLRQIGLFSLLLLFALKHTYIIFIIPLMGAIIDMPIAPYFLYNQIDLVE
jgi:hypothetical protein